MTQSVRKPFTGRHMAVIMVAFFGVVISVNVTMAVFAASTFGGKVVDNSYVATRQFNAWLDQARAQGRLGWRERVRLDAQRRVEVALAAGDSPLTGASVSADARHPVGRADDVALTFVEIAPGRYRSNGPLPEGRWRVHFAIRASGDEKRLIEILR
jgi:nitrogen fixation protein FixH